MDKAKFRILDKVKILPLDREGSVMEIRYGLLGIMYEVRFFYDGDIRGRYFFAEELKKVGKLKKEGMGFV